MSYWEAIELLAQRMDMCERLEASSMGFSYDSRGSARAEGRYATQVLARLTGKPYDVVLADISAALGKYWAENGLTVVPTLSWAQPSSYKFCFKGIPKHSTVATSTVGVVRDKDAQAVWFDGMREAMRQLQPSRVLLYGKDIGFDFGETEVIEYANGVTERMDANGR